MDIGMNLPVMVPGLDRSTILDWCRRIDAGPYRTLAVGKRIPFPNSEAMVTLSAAAAIPTSGLGRVEGSLSDRRRNLIAAIDLLFTGI